MKLRTGKILATAAAMAFGVVVAVSVIGVLAFVAYMWRFL